MQCVGGGGVGVCWENKFSVYFFLIKNSAISVLLLIFGEEGGRLGEAQRGREPAEMSEAAQWLIQLSGQQVRTNRAWKILLFYM